ncbi:hypothetical protein ABW19_dt0204460 [Dactylella cylindrospora]|nr:hypothetical protein ABW19_dt0204460 [Dactylella cylindrospora]
MATPQDSSSNSGSNILITQSPTSHPLEIDSLIIDTGPIIKNLCTPQSLLRKSSKLLTVPAVFAEIRDAESRSRFDTFWAPFLSYRSPRPESVNYIANFAKTTGDYGVLGTTDIQVLALTYEIECEHLGGQEQFENRRKEKELENSTSPTNSGKSRRRGGRKPKNILTNTLPLADSAAIEESEDGWTTIPTSKGKKKKPLSNFQHFTQPNLEPVSISEEPHLPEDTPITTPLREASVTPNSRNDNVLLQLHIHLFSPATMSRITSVKSHVLRCHACFKVVREMDRQFCPSCGQPSLTKVTCSTDVNGIFRVHLKKNWQWNNRGNVFSMAKPQHGTASMKGVRENIILSEDQKEYEKAVKESKKFKEKDLMDRDYLPGLLTGERLGHGGNPKVGAGRNINASKRRVK